MKPPRTVIVTRRFWPLAGSTESLMARLAVGLAQAGCPTTIVTTRWHARWPAAIRYHDIPVVRLWPPPEGRLNIWRSMRSLGAWLRAHEAEIDLVYVAGLRHEACAVIESLGGRRPVIVAPQRSGRYGDCFWQLDASRGRRIKSHCMRATALAAYDPALRNELEAAGYPRPAVRDLPRGVPLLPSRTPGTRAAARTMLAEANLRLRLADRAPLVVCTNRLSTERGWESLVAAWRVVARHWPTARLWLAGEASDHAAVLRRIASLDLAVQVVPIGIIHGIEVLLAAADVLVTPSPEGSPHALLEAFGAELPTVALDVSVNRWLVVDGREGLLTPPGDPAAISAAILRFLEHPELAAQCGAAARIRADREFSLARMVDEHLALFEECS